MADTNSRNLKGDKKFLVKNGCGQSGDEALKLTLFEEWANGINWFYACWHRCTKIKRWSKNVWMGMVKNGCG